MNKPHYINLAVLPSNEGTLVIKGEDMKEIITYEGMEMPTIDEDGNVIKPGRLLNVKRNT